MKEFCEVLLNKVNEDARSIKEEDSWVRVQAFGTAMVVVAGNFYCVSSASTQREFNEDILMMARETAEKLSLIFFEPRMRNIK